MKKKLFFLVYFLLISGTTLAQEKAKPITIHSLIGGKLDRAEEEYFKLFPMIEAVQEAEFYLNPDSTLRAIVIYESNGVIEDTLIEKYLPVNHIRHYIDQKLTAEINATQNIDRGKYVSALSSNEFVIGGEMLSTRETSFLLLNMEEEIYYNNSNSSFDVSNIQLSDLNKVTSIEKTNIAKYIYPIVAGLTAAFIYASMVDVKYTSFDIDENVKRGIINTLGGVLVAGLGCLIGYGISSVLPIWNVSETEYTAPFNEDDIKGLSELSRYQVTEPFYLQKIK